MEVLSVKMIGKYDYIKTKNYVEEELFNLKILGTRLMCLLPPDAGRQINLLDKVSASYGKSSKQEKFVEKKDYIEREIEKELEKHGDSLALLTDEETVLLKEEFIYQNNIVQIEEKYGWSIDKIKHLRKSYMIKFALSKGEYFESWYWRIVMIIKLFIGLLIGLFLLFVFSCCKVASDSDKYMEEYKDEKEFNK